MRGLLESKKHTKNKKKDRIKMTRFRKIESISLSNEEFFEIKKGRFSKKGIDYVERSVDLIDPVPHVMPVELNRFSIFSSLSQTRFCLKKIMPIVYTGWSLRDLFCSQLFLLVLQSLFMHKPSINKSIRCRDYYKR